MFYLLPFFFGSFVYCPLFCLVVERGIILKKLAPDESITITIDGDCPPYTWKAGGRGFAIGASITEDEFNTLNADADVCGSIEIIVKDNCGEEISGFSPWWCWKLGIGQIRMPVSLRFMNVFSQQQVLYIGSEKCAMILNGHKKYHHHKCERNLSETMGGVSLSGRLYSTFG